MNTLAVADRHSFDQLCQWDKTSALISFDRGLVTLENDAARLAGTGPINRLANPAGRRSSNAN